MENAFALCLFAGLREGECLGLSWSQIDFEKKRITINQQLQKSKSDNQYSIVPFTKSDKPRTIEPPAIAFDYLRNEQKKQAEFKEKAFDVWSIRHLRPQKNHKTKIPLVHRKMNQGDCFIMGGFEQLYRFKNLVGVKLGVNGVLANIKKREKTRKLPKS